MIVPRRGKPYKHYGSPVSHNPTAGLVNAATILVVIGFLIWVFTH